ncbi:cytochrome P450 [Mycena metata]|uniref:Cytochrome P450 n=1 Tax=Mycena metata TaxID=1033252 RepID=A0AAD7HZ48_9AGAR|nr:cytochrome P450 [Mycena metata]
MVDIFPLVQPRPLMLLRALASLALAIVGAQVARKVYRIVHRHFFSAFSRIPGPPNPSWIRGNFGRLTLGKTQEWQAQYGPTFKVHTLFSATQLYTIDTVALHRIINLSEIYQKAPFVRARMSSLLGRGLLVTEDDEHTKLSPAFGLSQVRGLTQLFIDKSLELSEFWAGQPTEADGWARIDVMVGLKAMTLDVIGLAGFNYHFNSLDKTKSATELDSAFQQLFTQTASRNMSIRPLIRAMFPITRFVLPSSKKLTGARETMDRIGLQLLQDAKAQTLSGEKDYDRRDLLSLLVKSNMSQEIPESQRLSDAVVVARTFLYPFLQHTTPAATTWALYALALHPEVQTTLRAELLSMGTDAPSVDALNGLPYLEKVVREVMRVHSPVLFTNRMATQDDILPLGTPYTDTRGVQQDSIFMAKGQMIWVPIASLNRDPRIWGPDAAEFKPDRWDAVPEAANAIPGVWAHLFSFLGGPHNCIGWRFSLAEMKSLLYILIRAFEFELAVSPDKIATLRTAVQRPMVIGEEEKGPQLPMRVRRV